MATNLFDLSGKIALVTGSSRRIGEEIAKLLAEQGAHVIVSSRKLDGCQAEADAIAAAGGSAVSLIPHPSPAFIPVPHRAFTLFPRRL